MRGASLTYNGIKIALVKTNEIDARVQMTDDGVDYLWTIYTINVNGILNPQETSYAPGPQEVAGILPPDTYMAIRHALLQPRGRLTFENFNRQVFIAPPQGYVVDANNGPKPLDLKIHRLDGAKLWHINYVIEICVIECPNVSSILLSNRFSQTQTINSEFLTTSITKGIAYFRTDLLAASGRVADSFRSVLLPRVPQYFQRKSMRFGVNTKGNAIEYEVVDQEKMYDLGDTGLTGSRSFITDIDGYYNISTINAAHEEGALPSGMAMATMNVKIKGSKSASNWNLTQIAFELMSSSGKMPIGNLAAGTVHQFSITQSITQSYVDVTLSMRINSDAKSPFGTIRVSGLQRDDVFPNFNGINPTPPQGKMTRGTASLDLISSQLKDACNAILSPADPPSTDSATAPEYSRTPPVFKVYPTDQIPSSPNRYSTDQENAPYTRSQNTSHYDTWNGKCQVPISGTAYEGGGSEADKDKPTCAVVTLHKPMSKRTVIWQVERIGKKPKIPSYNSPSKDEVLLDYQINMMDIVVLNDGVTPCYSVSGKYIYALRKDIASQEKLAFDIPQWIDYPHGLDNLVLPPKDQAQGGDFVNGIIS